MPNVEVDLKGNLMEKIVLKYVSWPLNDYDPLEIICSIVISNSDMKKILSLIDLNFVPSRLDIKVR